MSGELAVARVAARQQAMITTAQLLNAGLSERTIRARVESGWLTRRHTGVLQLGVFGGPFGAEAAALLACGADAVISLAGLEVDAVWAQQRLVVEVDGWTYHHTRKAFERDRRRDADLHAAGHRVLRVTWARIVDEPAALVASVALAYGQRMRGPA